MDRLPGHPSRCTVSGGCSCPDPTLRACPDCGEEHDQSTEDGRCAQCLSRLLVGI